MHPNKKFAVGFSALAVVLVALLVFLFHKYGTSTVAVSATPSAVAASASPSPAASPATPSLIKKVENKIEKKLKPASSPVKK